jgi:hypothetical protein
MGSLARFLLCLLAFGQGLAIAVAAVTYHPGPLLDMRGGGDVAGAAGAVLGLMVLGAGVGAAVLLAVVNALLHRRSRKDHGIAAAALALNVLQLGHLADHFSPTLFWALLAGTASIVALLLLPSSRRGWASAALLGGGLITAAIPSALDQASRARQGGLDQLGNTIEELAEKRDDTGLRQKLDALHQPVDLIFAIELLVIRGDYLPEIDIILKHPNTPPNQCIAVLRGERDFNGFKGNGNSVYEEICAMLATVLGARWDNAKVLSAGLARLGPDGAMADPLFNLARVDIPATMRMLRAAGLLNKDGKVDPAHYNDPFISNVWNRLDSPTSRHFLLNQFDLDALLVATLWQSGDPEHPAELIKAGAHPNFRSLCGATPLSTILTSSLQDQTIKLLIDAGADPDLPGAARCLGLPTTKPILEKPLTLLLRHAKEGAVPDDEVARWRKILGR